MPFTLAEPCSFQETIRKSRFLTHAAPVATPEEAQAFIQSLSDLTATHNCWAWKIGTRYRFSDDGEPGGTAGRPMLTAIEGQDCDRVVVVVTRWFGGIQLGTGGLARAYGGSAAKCLQGGRRIELIPRVRCRCRCLFAELGPLRARLGEFGAAIEEERFETQGAELILAVPQSRLPELGQWLADLSRGRMQLQVLAEQAL
ncbi:IMPACT family protein [Stutzerimonas azotifigens]|uniref:IMPACT family protein n=1 Tax=Stutzerimonas azotifigens TaxID=291995 RepID=UPI0004003593|nr:YigZ family protein [Stutzerimonas azotifigens]